MSKRKKKKIPSNLELIQSQRGDWNGINPVTRIVESKKNKPVKHKKREMESEQDAD